MKYRNEKFALIVLLLLAPTYRANAQTNFRESEQQLSKWYYKILNDPGSSDKYSETFGTAFKKLIKANPSTINYHFSALRDSGYCHIVTSNDGKLRIYSWDTWTGGTMHFYNQIYQFKAGSRVFTKIPVYEEGDPGEYCTEIYTVPVNGKTYYLVVGNGRYSNIDCWQAIAVYTINGSQLSDTTMLFKTKKERLNSIAIEFHPGSEADKSINYDKLRKVVYIPLVDGNNEVTDKHLVYQLSGNYFKYIGVEKGR